MDHCSNSCIEIHFLFPALTLIKLLQRSKLPKIREYCMCQKLKDISDSEIQRSRILDYCN